MKVIYSIRAINLRYPLFFRVNG